MVLIVGHTIDRLFPHLASRPLTPCSSLTRLLPFVLRFTGLVGRLTRLTSCIDLLLRLLLYLCLLLLMLDAVRVIRHAADDHDEQIQDRRRQDDMRFLHCHPSYEKEPGRTILSGSFWILNRVSLIAKD